jgi:hypothetical protein
MFLFYRKYRGFALSISLIIALGAVGLLGGSFVFGRNYFEVNELLKQSEEMMENDDLDKAIEILDSIENQWIVRRLGIKRNQIMNMKLSIEHEKRALIEEELAIVQIEKEVVEQQVEEEQIKRVQAEAKVKQEEFEKNLKAQQLSAKEVEEKKMNADNDGDGLTYRQELEYGTSDWDTDSDGDGIPDNLDLHPAGGGRNITQNFQWKHSETLWTWDYPIHEDWYEYYKSKPRSAQGPEYITSNDPFIKAIAQELTEASNKNNYHLSSFIISFIQGLPYVEDYYTSFDEYPKYPIETFIERNGDCEDTSYLFASLIQSTGLGAALIQFHNHMGVGIKTVHSQQGYYYPIGDDWYYYYETTGTGWQIGDLPEAYINEKAKIIVLWDNSVYYVTPQHIKSCYVSSDFSGYYTDGKNFYSDSQCSNLTYCLRYEEFYYNLNTKNFYHDSSCSMIAIAGCYKSTYNPGYFFDANYYYYSDSRCLNRVYTTTTTWRYTTTTTAATFPSTTTTTTTTTTTEPPTTTTTTTEPPTTTTIES